MLILTRRAGESIRIAENILITVVELKRGQVRLGVVAPPNAPILRQELLGSDSDRTALSAASVQKAR